MIKQILTPLAIAVAACFCTYLIIRSDQKKTAVVDAVRLFNEYHMKIELEKEAAGRLKFMGGKLDSVEKELRLFKTIEDVPKEMLEYYQTMKRNLDKDYSESNQMINEQVWKRLNPLVEKFGKEKELHLIIGANGMGTVLYKDAYYDLTDELISYVNKNYEGATL